MKSNIAVFTEVFNEESRIENFCEFFKWADEIIIIDKSSTDKTVELAKKYTDNVFIVPYSDTTQYAQQIISDYATECEWYFIPTASAAIDPGLVNELIKLTSSDDFPFDVISLPLKMYVLGISSQFSPWSAKSKNICIRKTAIKLSREVHNETGHYGNKVYRGLLNFDSYLYHFTHGSVDTLFERHLRYTRQEASQKFVNGDLKLSHEFKALIKAFLYVIFRKRTYLMGWDGVALSLAYVSYFAMRFIYSWEILRGINSGVYSDEIGRIKKLWQTEKR